MESMLYFLFIAIIALSSCGPQTETRAHMDRSGMRMSDSLERYIDSSLAQPSLELMETGSPIASGASTFTSVEASK
jgi:hypothetical protein